LREATRGLELETRLTDSASDFVSRVEPLVPAMTLLAGRLAGLSSRDDVVQDALASAWAKRGQFDPVRGSLKAWLLTITANAARRRGRHKLVAVPSPSTGSDAELKLDVIRALESLTPRERLAIDCHYYVGLSVAETSVVMRCSEGTVKSTLSTARERLRGILEGDLR
jgi:RNA polymerase sigma-70 factor, ECF subfamily